MAVEYQKVLTALHIDSLAIGRGEESAVRFEEKTSTKVFRGGVEHALTQHPLPDAAIVSVNVENLASATIALLHAGVRRILVEKPAGLTSQEIDAIQSKTEALRAEVYVAYNRRFLASVSTAQRLIAEDGGVSSFSFEFTEWSHIIASSSCSARDKERLFLTNSSHVVDLAFFLGGRPQEICCFTAGELQWHPSACSFAGAGRSESGALFSYQANWDAPGRWGVELMTNQRRFIFRPLEKLQVQKKGSVAIEQIQLDDALDVQFKPGLYREVQCFLNGETETLCSIDEQAARMAFFNRIANYH
jgi:predicted dehydrogenase